MVRIRVGSMTFEVEDEGNKESKDTIVLISGLGMQLIDWPEQFIDAFKTKNYRYVFVYLL